MKRMIVVFLAIAALSWVGAQAQEKMPAKPKSAALAQMKLLVGEWNGDNGVETFRAVSNGTALEATFSGPHDTQMVTVYTPDGDKLAMTHYCAAGNQPRMETGTLTGTEKEFQFKLTGITNLAKEDEGHMVGLTIHIEDKDHFTERWTWIEAGKTSTEVFHLTRKA